MKRNFLIFAALIFAVLSFTFFYMNEDHSKRQTVESEERLDEHSFQDLPHFTAQDLSGKIWTKDDFKNQILLIHFWASWCAPCVVELPKLIQLARDEPQYKILAISSDSDSAILNRFLKRQNFENLPSNFIIIHDSEQMLTQNIFQTFKLPETILVNKKGQMTQKIAGDADWGNADLRARLKALQ